MRHYNVAALRKVRGDPAAVRRCMLTHVESAWH
jgi:hypothetical protein